MLTGDYLFKIAAASGICIYFLMNEPAAQTYPMTYIVAIFLLNLTPYGERLVLRLMNKTSDFFHWCGFPKYWRVQYPIHVELGSTRTKISFTAKNWFGRKKHVTHHSDKVFRK